MPVSRPSRAGRRGRACARPRRRGRRAASQGRVTECSRAAARPSNTGCATSSPRSTRRATDDRVKAVALDLDGFTGGGQSALSDLSDAIRGVRASGKPVLAYATGYTDDSYQLAAAASEIWLNPLGLVAVAGPGGSAPLLQGPARQAWRHPARLSRRHLQGRRRAVHAQRHVAGSARERAGACQRPARNLARERPHARPKAKVDAYMRNMPARFRPRAATWPKPRSTPAWSTRSQTGRPSSSGWRSSAARMTVPSAATSTSSFRPIVEERRKISGRPDRSRHRCRHDRRRQGVRRHRRRRQHRGADREGPRRRRPQGARRARRQPGRLGPCVRTHPPGDPRSQGRKLPVVVSMGNVAASGGYWVSTPADFIYAEPSTITGSIGVFGILPSFEGTREKLGLGADGVKTTPLSGEPDLLNGPSPEAEQLLQTGVESIYRRFLGIVAQSRHKSPAADRPDRPGPRVGRRHRPPAWPRRRLRRNGRGDRQGGPARQARRRARRHLS